MKNIKLQKIIFPINSDTTSNLYIRKEINSHYNILKFDTYFNMFSNNTWKKYTNIKKVYINLCFYGKCKITLYGINSNGHEKKLKSEIFDFKEFCTASILYPDNNFDSLYFILETEKNFNFKEGWYSSDVNYYKNIFLDIVICTFKREEYLKKNINLLSIFYKDYPELENTINIHIVDNGQTLSKNDLPGDNFFLYYNLNTGGSGGFTRGILEVLKKDSNTTHILLLDDDIEIIPESIFRSITFLSICKHEYQASFLGGAMLDMQKKHIQHESVALWDKNNFFCTMDEGLDLRYRNNCIYNSTVIYKGKNFYQGWWYCIIPISQIKKIGLPYPFFLRLDDVEYSLRNNKDILHLNGICVWHEPFYNKTSSLINYFTMRNALILNSLGTKSNCTFKLLQNIIKGIITFNYPLSYSCIYAIEDFLDGPNILEDINTYDRILKNKNIKDNINNIKHSNYKRYTINSYKDITSLSFFEKILCIITFNFHLYPFFTKKESIIFSNEKFKMKNYYMYNKIIIINNSDMTYKEMHMNFKKFIDISIKSIIIFIKFLIKNIFGRL